MPSYMLTAHTSAGWLDIQVHNAGNLREAIGVAEGMTGCLVSHGTTGAGQDFHPGVTIDAASGRMTKHRLDTPAKPLVELGRPLEPRRGVEAMR